MQRGEDRAVAVGSDVVAAIVAAVACVLGRPPEALAVLRATPAPGPVADVTAGAGAAADAGGSGPVRAGGTEPPSWWTLAGRLAQHRGFWPPDAWGRSHRS
ncbi:MAG: hypothetical protein IRY95_01585 [Clostridia bacterium]|nr:hypothetical protein [Clostridia bacterium]